MRPGTECALLKAVLWALGVLPAPVSVLVGKGLALVWYLLDGRHRRKILADIERTPLASLPLREKKRMVRRMYLHYGVMLAELAKFRRWPAERVKACIDFAEGEKLREAAQESNVLVVSAHFGNWELTGMCLPLYGVKMAVVARPLKNPCLDDLLNSIRTRFGQKTMKKFNVMREIIKSMREGYSIGVLIDQDAERDCVYVPFLGETAATLTVPAKLAVKYGMPIFCVVSYRERPFRHRYRIIGPIECPREGDDAVEKACRAFNDAISQVILEHPEQWMWLHHRWRGADKKGLTRAAAAEGKVSG